MRCNHLLNCSYCAAQAQHQTDGPELGWYYADAEYPEEGWVGSFDTREAALQNALDIGECVEADFAFREIGDVSKLRADLAAALAGGGEMGKRGRGRHANCIRIARRNHRHDS